MEEGVHWGEVVVEAVAGKLEALMVVEVGLVGKAGGWGKAVLADRVFPTN